MRGLPHTAENFMSEIFEARFFAIAPTPFMPTPKPDSKFSWAAATDSARAMSGRTWTTSVSLAGPRLQHGLSIDVVSQLRTSFVPSEETYVKLQDSSHCLRPETGFPGPASLAAHHKVFFCLT